MAQAPEHAWEDQQDSVWSMLYSGEHYRGKSTQVFAYYADPSTLSDQPATSDHYPGIILVHGGGGTAFRVWAKQWAQRGYAALAMDLRGSKPLPESEQNHVWGTKSVRLSNGGPTENHQTQFSNIDEPYDEQWQFHAVSNIIRAHSLLRSFDHVDEQSIVLTGISWGGYLTCLLAGIDHRFRAAVPVYGSGFLNEGSYWTTHQVLDSLGREKQEKWINRWDPSQYLPDASMPMLFINGTNDFAYYAEAWNKSAGLVQDSRQLLIPEMKHSHKDGAEPEEIAAFFDMYLLGQQKFPLLDKIHLDGDTLKAAYEEGEFLKEAFLIYSDEDKLNPERKWSSIAANIYPNEIKVIVPKRAKVFYLNTTSKDNLKLSSKLFQR